jgi:EAL domain-containing protein (putative c-di-GMP-specific phosphodiesterase class I)
VIQVSPVRCARCAAIRLRLSIDDFGFDYSSLSRLAEFDRATQDPQPFVDRLIGEDADQTFVDAILRLAGSLGLVSTSEGVEHVGQARALRDLGCGLAQGFLFAEPMTGESVFRLLRGSAAHRGAPTLDSALAFARSYEPSALASS